MTLDRFDAVIFDMDGVLMDSEPLWWQSEVEVFGELGIDLTLDDCKKTMGIRVDAVVQLYFDRFGWEGPTVEQVATDLVQRVADKARAEGVEIPGACAAVRSARQAGMLVALATSSPAVLIDAVLKRLGVAEAFDVVQSASSETYGKPHPAVFLTTASRLGVAPERCLVFEDSMPGVIAAKAASMWCVAIPHGFPNHSPKFAIADEVWPSLEQFGDLKSL